MAEMSIKEFYDKVKELSEYETNEKSENNLTEWFGDYGMYVPKIGVTNKQIIDKLENQKKGI